MKFTEAKLEQTFIEFLGNEGYPLSVGSSIIRSGEDPACAGTANREVLIEEDLISFLMNRYEQEKLTEIEAQSIVLQLKTLSSADLYETNKKIMRWLSDGFILKREDRSQKDIHISLIDYSDLERQIPACRTGRKSKNLDTIASEPSVQYPLDTNIYKFVNQLEIVGMHRRIPDGILYINGIPVVVFE